MEHMSFETIMDILDWFDDSLFDYINHILLSKLDGERRIQLALPDLRLYAQELVERYRDTQRAYPGGT